MNIQEIRQKYPQYNDLSDTELATALHQKYYADIPFEDFSQRIGLEAQPAAQPDIDLLRGKGFFETKESGERLGAGERTGILVEHAPELAATAASIAAPQIAAPALAARFGPTLARAAGPVLRNLPKIGSATAAGGAGGGLREAVSEDATPGSVLRETGESALEMGGAEIAGLGAAGAISKVLAPGVRTLTEQGKNILQFARQNKLPLKPSAVSPSATAKAIESGVESFLPGRAFKQFANKKIANVLATDPIEANRFISRAAQVEGANSPGFEKTIRSSTRAIKTGLENWTPKVEAKYARFTEAIGGRDRWTSYPKLRGVMETIADEQRSLAGGADESIVKFINDFRAKFPEQVNADDLYKQYKRLGHIKGADKRHLGLIRDAFKEEFDDLAQETGGQATKLLQDANKEYILGKRFFKGDPVIKKIASGDIQDSRVTVELFRDSKFSTLKQLESNIPKENFDNLKRLNLENLIQNSSVRPSDNPFISILDGNKLLRWIEKNPKTFKLYPKETQDSLRNLALYAKFHGKEAIAGAQGFGRMIEETAVRTAVGGGAALAAGGVPGLVISSAAAPAIAWSMMRPNSVVNRWLVKGEIGPFARGINEGLKLGGRMVFSGEE